MDHICETNFMFKVSEVRIPFKRDLASVVIQPFGGPGI